jgi:hypothetical protein
MAKDEAASTLQAKDILLLVPLVASSVAISFQVGRFLPFAGFGYFTLSEHLIAAIGALPLALSLVSYFALWIALMTRIPELPELPERRKRVLFAAATTAGIAGSLGAHFLAGGFHFYLAPPLGAVILVGLLANVLWYRHSLTSPLGLLFSYATAIFFTMLLANDISLNNMRMSRDHSEKVLSEIFSKSGSYKAYVIMRGEQGILLYNPDNSRVSFQRTEDIQKIEWAR